MLLKNNICKQHLISGSGIENGSGFLKNSAKIIPIAEPEPEDTLLPIRNNVYAIKFALNKTILNQTELLRKSHPYINITEERIRRLCENYGLRHMMESILENNQVLNGHELHKTILGNEYQNAQHAPFRGTVMASRAKVLTLQTNLNTRIRNILLGTDDGEDDIEESGSGLCFGKDRVMHYDPINDIVDGFGPLNINNIRAERRQRIIELLNNTNVRDLYEDLLSIGDQIKQYKETEDTSYNKRRIKKLYKDKTSLTESLQRKVLIAFVRSLPKIVAVSTNDDNNQFTNLDPNIKDIDHVVSVTKRRIKDIQMGNQINQGTTNDWNDKVNYNKKASSTRNTSRVIATNDNNNGGSYAPYNEALDRQISAKQKRKHPPQATPAEIKKATPAEIAQFALQKAADEVNTPAEIAEFARQQEQDERWRQLRPLRQARQAVVPINNNQFTEEELNPEPGLPKPSFDGKGLKGRVKGRAISYTIYKQFCKKYEIKLSKNKKKKTIPELQKEIHNYEINNNIKKGLYFI